MRRRSFVLGVAAAVGKPEAGTAVKDEVFLRSPGKGTAVLGYAYYTGLKGGDLLSIEQRWSRSDTVDKAFYRRSRDNGRTWSAPEERVTGEKRKEGMLRRHPRGGWADPGSGRFVEFWLEGILPTDDPLEGLRQWNIYYTIDGGAVRQLIHKGAEYNARHPLPGVRTGQNSVALGDQPSRPIAGKDRSILLPVDLTLAAADGSLYNPGGGYTYHDSAVLHGKWRGGELEWEMSARLEGDPARTTRGLCEPTIEWLTGDRLLMVMRGSNDRKPQLQGYKWYAISSDGGWTWTKAAPWTYTDGDAFFSPSSCSQLVRHSSGRLFWLGNLCEANPKGNLPRDPFVMGEVDREKGLLIRDSVRVVAKRAAGEEKGPMLSNFYAREDRETKEICVHMTPLYPLPDGWLGDANLYRIAV